MKAGYATDNRTSWCIIIERFLPVWLQHTEPVVQRCILASAVFATGSPPLDVSRPYGQQERVICVLEDTLLSVCVKAPHFLADK